MKYNRNQGVVDAPRFGALELEIIECLEAWRGEEEVENVSRG